MTARRTIRRDEDSLSELLEDKTDMTFLNSLMEVIRNGAKESRFNRHQLKLLSDRCGAIHRTLAMMHHTTPAPNTLSAFRSAEYLVTHHLGEGWETFLVHRFTASELFESCRTKIRMVWSLQSTARWETEDEEAEAKDVAENIALMRTLQLTMPVLPTSGAPPPRSTTEQSSSSTTAGGATFSQQDLSDPSATPVVRLNLADDEEVLHFYQRRKISGWKLPYNSVDLVSAGEPLSEVESSSPTAGKDEQGQKPSHSSTSQLNMVDRRYFRRPRAYESKRFSYGGYPLCCLELTNQEFISPKTLENFIIDMKCRYNWSHPNLVKCVGGFAEKFHPKSGAPYLSLGAWFEDIEAKAGYVSLHELLYSRGRRYHISTALQMVLLVADALQYAIFSSVDVSPEVVDAWALLSPARILVSTDDDKAVAAEVGRSKTVDRVPGMQGECHVRFNPSFYVEDGEVSRWTPPCDAGNKHCYALTQLLVAILANAVPFAECITQEEVLRNRGGQDHQHTVVDVVDSASGAVRKEQRPIGVPREEEPDSMKAPKMIPKSLQEFITRGFAHKRNLAKIKRQKEEQAAKDAEGRNMFSNMLNKVWMAGISVDVAEDEGAQPFSSIQHFRRELSKVARSSEITNLGNVSPHISKAWSEQLPGDQTPAQGPMMVTSPSATGRDESPASPSGVVDATATASNSGAPDPMVVLDENAIHKGFDVGPMHDFKHCNDYGFPSPPSASSPGLPERSPLVPPTSRTSASEERDSSEPVSSPSRSGVSPAESPHEV